MWYFFCQLYFPLIFNVVLIVYVIKSSELSVFVSWPTVDQLMAAVCQLVKKYAFILLAVDVHMHISSVVVLLGIQEL